MKIKLSSTILLFIVAVVSTGFAQEKPKAVLIDEFEPGNCEITKARVDNLMAQVTSNVQLHGVIVINAKNDAMRTNLIYEEMLRGSIADRGFSLDRVTFVRTNDKPEGLVRMWIVQDDADRRPQGSGAWNLTIPADAKPFIVGAEWYFADDICPPVDVPRILAEMLNANPAARSNVVIRPGSRLLPSNHRQRFFREMQKKYGVSKTRIRFFFAKRARPLNAMSEPDTEFWLVPH